MQIRVGDASFRLIKIRFMTILGPKFDLGLSRFYTTTTTTTTTIISATVPELARHEVGVVVHRAKRVQRFECPTMNDVNDLR